MIQYNDYELLYLMSELEIEAEEILFKKYTNLILSRIKKFRIQERYRDDFLQEGLIYLNVAIKTFNPDCGKSFNKYFDLILQRRFIQILIKEQGYFYNVTLTSDIGFVMDNRTFEYSGDDVNKYSELERKVLNLKLKGYRPKEISQALGCEVKSVYNCLVRLRKKNKEL